MQWFLVYLCDEDTVNTSATYEDLILAENEDEAKKLAALKCECGIICIGVKPASNKAKKEEVAHGQCKRTEI